MGRKGKEKERGIEAEKEKKGHWFPLEHFQLGISRSGQDHSCNYSVLHANAMAAVKVSAVYNYLITLPYQTMPQICTKT